MATFKLKAQDGDPIDVDEEVISCSPTIKAMFNNLGSEDGDKKLIPLPSVDHATLLKVIEWATHHKDNPPPPQEEEDDDNTETDTENMSAWETEFLNVDKEMIFKLVLAAHYLKIKELGRLAAKPVTNMLKGKTTEEMRDIFNVKNDFTDEEEALIQRENEYCDTA